MVIDFVSKPGTSRLALVPLIGMTVAICHKNICILLKNDKYIMMMDTVAICHKNICILLKNDKYIRSRVFRKDHP